MDAITKKVKNEEWETLRDKAICRLLDKMDIDLLEWMSETETQEYLKLEYDLGYLTEEDYLSLKG